jgi:hypothetical protein
MVKRVREEVVVCPICHMPEELTMSCDGFDGDVHEKCCELWMSVTPMLRKIYDICCVGERRCFRRNFFYENTVKQVKSFISPMTVHKYYMEKGEKFLLFRVNKVIGYMLQKKNESFELFPDKQKLINDLRTTYTIDDNGKFVSDNREVNKAWVLVQQAMGNDSLENPFKGVDVDHIVEIILTGENYNEDELDLVTESLERLASKIAENGGYSKEIVKIAMLSMYRGKGYYSGKLLKALKPLMSKEGMGELVMNQAIYIMDFSDNFDMRSVGIRLLRFYLAQMKKGEVDVSFLTKIIDISNQYYVKEIATSNDDNSGGQYVLLTDEINRHRWE